MSDDGCDDCDQDGPDLNEIMSEIDRQVTEGIRSALRQQLFQVVQQGTRDDYLSSDEVLAIAEGLVADGVLVADIRKRISEQEDARKEMYPLAEIWRGWVEQRHGKPYEFTSSVVRRGDVSVFFSSDSARIHPQRFANEVDRAEWKMSDGSEIAWADLEGQGDVDDPDGTAAWDAWDEIRDGGAVGTRGGIRYSLSGTEDGDVLLVPEGMFSTIDHEVPPLLEDPDAYYSWPRDTIDKDDDPQVLGWQISSLILGVCYDLFPKPPDRPCIESPYWNTLLVYVKPPADGGGTSVTRTKWSMTWKWSRV